MGNAFLEELSRLCIHIHRAIENTVGYSSESVPSVSMSYCMSQPRGSFPQLPGIGMTAYIPIHESIPGMPGPITGSDP